MNLFREEQGFLGLLLQKCLLNEKGDEFVKDHRLPTEGEGSFGHGQNNRNVQKFCWFLFQFQFFC